MQMSQAAARERAAVPLPSTEGRFSMETDTESDDSAEVPT